METASFGAAYALCLQQCEVLYDTKLEYHEALCQAVEREFVTTGRPIGKLRKQFKRNRRALLRERDERLQLLVHKLQSC